MSNEFDFGGLTPEEIVAWRALPPVSAEELEAIQKETPAESKAAAERIFRDALKASREPRKSLRGLYSSTKPLTELQEDRPFRNSLKNTKKRRVRRIDTSFQQN